MSERNLPTGNRFHSSEFGSSSEAFDYSELLSPEVRERYLEWRKTDAAKAIKHRQDRGHEAAERRKQVDTDASTLAYLDEQFDAIKRRIAEETQ